MAVGLGDIYEKLKELITITDKVRENTERIAKLEEKVETLHIDLKGMQANMFKLMDGQQRILERLEFKEELASLKIQLAEHLAASGKANA